MSDVLPFVDVAIFHSYWPNISTQEIPDVKSYMGGNPKPILVEEFGWPSNPTPCYRDGQLIYDYNETAQLNLYTSHLIAFAAHDIAGGIQWMTFDAKAYTTNQNESFENYFGLWTYSYSLKPAGIYYRDHFPVSLFPVEPDGGPPGPVTGFTALTSSGQVSLKWVNPSDADYVGTMIRCKTTDFPVDPTDGELVADRRKPRGSSDVFSPAGVKNGVTYYYSAFAYDGGPLYSVAAHVSARPIGSADFDGDGDVDLSDFALLHLCFSGPNHPPALPEKCGAPDFDLDGDVDLTDFAAFQSCFGGPNRPPAADCILR